MRRHVALALRCLPIVLFPCSRSLGATTYSTDFSAVQSPLADSAWSSGLDPLQTPVRTEHGIAFGTQTGLEMAQKNYNDSEAFLVGPFPPNQRASAVIHKAPGLSGGYTEVELLLRWSVGPLRKGLKYGETHSYGYEINLAWDGQYSGIARFKEEAICWSGNIASLGVQDGDEFSAEIVGSTITSSLRRKGVSHVLCTVTDASATPFASGSPGIGFYRGTEHGSITNSTSFAFTSFAATSVDAAHGVAVPVRFAWRFLLVPAVLAAAYALVSLKRRRHALTEAA